MISSKKTPKANTSVFSSTTPCIKYSGAKCLQQIIYVTLSFYQYPPNPTNEWKQSSCTQMSLQLEWWNGESTEMEAILLTQNQISRTTSSKQNNIIKTSSIQRGSRLRDFYLWFIICSQQDIGRLDVPMNDSSWTIFVQIMEAFSGSYGNLIPCFPIHWRQILICQKQKMNNCIKRDLGQGVSGRMYFKREKPKKR